MVHRIGPGNLVLYISNSGVLQRKRGYIFCPRANLPRFWREVTLLTYRLAVTELGFIRGGSVESN